MDEDSRGVLRKRPKKELMRTKILLSKEKKVQNEEMYLVMKKEKISNTT